MDEKRGREKAIENYEKLFQTVEGNEDIEGKAQAFDKLAEKYYYCNFGSTSKADLDVLMFSIYIERILDKSQKDFNSYSDYTLSKNLGITQSKISNLKVKKELQYPYENFRWEESFAEIAKNAIYEDDKIKLHIPDKNLFLEIKNAIERNGGFVDIQLNSNLLQIKPAFFFDLILAMYDDSESQIYREKIKRTLLENDELHADTKKYLEEVSIGQALKNEAPAIIASLISKCIPIFGDSMQSLLELICGKIIDKVKR